MDLNDLPLENGVSAQKEHSSLASSLQAVSPQQAVFRCRTWPYEVKVLPFLAERHVSVVSRRSLVSVYLQVPSGSLSRCVELF